MKTRDMLFEEAKSIDIQEKKLARLSLFMTAADLCDNCKRWDDNLPTVKGILQEFFTQGDMERQLGLQPAAQMDRRIAYIPQIEYKFLKFVVAPVYSYLTQMYGDLKPCLQNIKYHEDMWTRATYVYDKYKGREGLEILELPEMHEENLLKIKLDMPLDKLKHRKFSLQTPPTPIVSKASTRSSVSASLHRQSISGSSRKSITPTASETTKKSRPSMMVEPEQEDEALEDVDTGENRRRFCPCCKKK